MKSKNTLFYLLFLISIAAKSQGTICADSSYRIKFTFDGEGATLNNNPDTTGYNYFAGQALRGQYPGIALLKTTWGDSIIWAKKIFSNNIFLDCYSAFPAPAGTIILIGNCRDVVTNKPEILICCADTNGVVKWIKKYEYNQIHLYGGSTFKPLLIKNNAIYLTARVYTPSTVTNNRDISIVAKLDLSGNIIWSKAFSINFTATGSTTNTGITGAPVLLNNKIIVCGDSGFAINNSAGLAIFTKLNEIDGSLSESFGYKTQPDQLLAGIGPLSIKHTGNNSLIVTSFSKRDFYGTPVLGNLAFTELDTNLTPLKNYYFEENFLGSFIFDHNDKAEQVILATDRRFGKSNEKYFFSLNNTLDILKSKKFIIPNYQYSVSLLNYYDTKFDDKKNIHYTIQAIENNKPITDYTRISNFAPNSTLGCFGKDTSLLIRHTFTLEKKPFAWDNIETNVLISTDVPYTIQDATVTKELVCKIVSYCDSIHITGPASTCLNSPARFSIHKNNTCLKNNDWSIDTSFASIVSLEGDSAITLSFKKPFTGYLHAALTDCVVKDSFLIKAVTPKMPPLINRTDSLLCPGKTLTLNASNGYTNYTWLGGAPNSKQLTVNTAGIYRITAQDSCNNPVTDSIAVTLSDTSLLLQATQTICLFDSAHITLPADVTSITWQPAAASLLRNSTIVAWPAQTTLYTITAERQTNCPINRVSLVTVKNCPQTFYIPNSFTPNGDGLNDKFKPVISQPLAAYRFTIYNRYGQSIFETTDQNKGWDGLYQNSRQPMGGYIYYCTYRFNGAPEKMLKGYFMLLH